MTDTFQGERSVSPEVFPPEYLITLQIYMRWFLPWFLCYEPGVLAAWCSFSCRF